MKETLEPCSCNMIHEEIVEGARAQLLDDTLSQDLARFFKVFGDPTRIRILSALFYSEMCVCDLASTLSMTHSAISHQLRIFKSAKLVKSRKEGKVVYYSLADNHIVAIFNQGLVHIKE